MPSTRRRLFAASAIGAAALLHGCAAAPPPSTKPPPRSVPGLSVMLDCRDCQVKSTVPELIRSSYAAAAAKAGVAIDESTPVMLTVKEYSERGWGMRTVALIAGPLAFMLKDEIKAVASISDQQLDIDYVHRMPFAGIESVAQHIGELSFEQVMAVSR